MGILQTDYTENSFCLYPADSAGKFTLFCIIVLESNAGTSVQIGGMNPCFFIHMFFIK
jgi:hypothetical protein